MTNETAQAISGDRDRLLARVAELAAERDRLAEVVDWYAEGCPVTACPIDGEPIGFEWDRGKRAREALGR